MCLCGLSIQSVCILPLKLWIPIFVMSLNIVTRYMGAAIKALDFGFEDVISQVGGSCLYLLGATDQGPGQPSSSSPS